MSSRQETVLLVDDDAAVRGLVRQFLEMSGYLVLEAPDAGKAIDICRSHGSEIGLLITDISMPGVGGVELVGQLNSLRPNMKILFISGFSERGEGVEPVQAGEAAFLQKPFTIRSLSEKVKALLG